MDINQVVISGRLTRPPELSYTKNNTPVCKLGIASNHDKEKVSFFDVTCWSGTAEAVAKYMDKGDEVYVVGEIRQDRWQDQNGNNRSKVVVNARQVKFGAKKQGGDRQPSNHQRGTQGRLTPETDQPAQQRDYDEPPTAMDGDDIPF